MKQRDHEYGPESHKYDSSDFPIRSNYRLINNEIGVATVLLHHSKAGSCYSIFLEEVFPELIKYTPIVIRKRCCFQYDVVPAQFTIAFDELPACLF